MVTNAFQTIDNSKINQTNKFLLSTPSNSFNITYYLLHFKRKQKNYK